jgi:hypothetical protein
MVNAFVVYGCVIDVVVGLGGLVNKFFARITNISVAPFINEFPQIEVSGTCVKNFFPGKLLNSLNFNLLASERNNLKKE